MDSGDDRRSETAPADGPWAGGRARRRCSIAPGQSTPRSFARRFTNPPLTLLTMRPPWRERPLNGGDEAKERGAGAARRGPGRRHTPLGGSRPHTGPSGYRTNHTGSSSTPADADARRTTGCWRYGSDGPGKGRAELVRLGRARASRSVPEPRPWRSARARPGNRRPARKPPQPSHHAEQGRGTRKSFTTGATPTPSM
jgi:hypothetical protein